MSKESEMPSTFLLGSMYFLHGWNIGDDECGGVAPPVKSTSGDTGLVVDAQCVGVDTLVKSTAVVMALFFDLEALPLLGLGGVGNIGS